VPEDIQPAFFTADGDAFRPAPHAKSFWAAGMLHGRLLGGLMARTLDREHGTEDLRMSRLTVDMFRNAPLAPVRVRTELLRAGHRIRVAEATVEIEGKTVARATGVFLRVGEQPPGKIPETPAWDAPDPSTVPMGPVRNGTSSWRFNEDNERVPHWPGDGRRRMWLRERCELVAGEENSPLVLAALAADSASPLAHASDSGLSYINADYTLYLSRLPEGEVIGLESGGHTSSEGIAVGQCTMHDARGPVGFCMTAALANPGKLQPRRPPANDADATVQ
jgi:hypothetical protein